MALLFGV